MKTKKSLRSPGRVVLWAVDPFDQETRPSAASVRALQRTVKDAGLTLQPVYLASLPPSELERGVLSHLEETENLLEELVKEYGLTGVAEPTVLLDETGTRQGAVKELLSFAKKEGAAWITLSSHGRSGLKRFVLGSFAEALLRESPLPVLALSDAWSGERKALFPTDFSSGSHRAFRRFLSYAAPLGLEVVLYHAISLPVPVLESQAMMVPSAYVPADYYPREEARAKRAGAAWMKEAAAAGVKARLVMSDRGVGILTGRLFLEAAEKAGAGMIALSFVSGAIDHLLFGSAALDTLRARKFPVWIAGPKAVHAPQRRTPLTRTRARGRAAKRPPVRKQAVRRAEARAQ